MPSPDSRRSALERASRVGALAALAALLVLPWTPSTTDRLDASSSAQLAQVLTDATLRPIGSVSVQLSQAPEASSRAWLRALRGAGTAVQWRVTDPLPATVLSTEPVSGPDGQRRVALSGIPAGGVSIRDALGIVDSASTDSVAARDVVARISGAVAVEVRGATLRTPEVSSVPVRAVLVLGGAGWEGRFTTAALEEAGWTVESEFIVTPRGPAGRTPDAGRGAAVRTRGASGAIDTARYAAVVALDAAAAPRSQAIARFVQQGGGLILGHAAAAGDLRALAPARPDAPFTETLGGLLTTTPRRGLGGRALAGLRPDALILERRGAAVTMAARRHELGRVVMLGYDDLWRWRMQGGEMSPEEHRAWWSQLVSSVAYAPFSMATNANSLSDPAPTASLHASLGPPGIFLQGAGTRRFPWPVILFTTCILLLMTEWTSRRLRGAP
jgi:hypothetical protein